MNNKTTRTPLTLAELIDLEYLLQRDGQSDRQEVRRRDQTIGAQFADLAGNRRALFLAWLERMRHDSPDPLPGETAIRALSLLSLLLIISGFLLGCGTGLGVFGYTGGHPVNVVHVIAVFVVLPLALLLLMLIAAMPHGALHVPGASAVQDLARLISPGRLLLLFQRLLPRELRQSLEIALGQMRSFDRLYGRLRTWLLLRLAQQFAVAFFTGALAGALSLIIFSDLAFGWGTTLQLPASAFHHLVKRLATPWSWFWPQASPSLQLVETTRYFRQGGHFAGLPASASAPQLALLGGWWPFLIACMLTYALLPRILTLILSSWRLRVALHSIPLSHAQFEGLYERLTDHGNLAENVAPSLANNSPIATAASEFAVILWEIALAQDSLAPHLSSPIHAMHSAGGMDLSRDALVLESLRSLHSGAAIVMIVKSWEATTRDFLRFLKSVRASAPKNASILVAPVELKDAIGTNADIAPAEEKDMQLWMRQMQLLGDPYLRVVNLFGEQGQ